MFTHTTLIKTMKINQLYQVKALEKIPMCTQECLVIISTQPACPLLSKGLGHSLQLLLLSFIYLSFVYMCYQNPLKTCLLVFTVIPCSSLLVNTFCSSLGSTLLFIESTTIHPLYLWVIKTIFWHRCRGVKRYWRVELVKKTFTVSVVFIFV